MNPFKRFFVELFSSSINLSYWLSKEEYDSATNGTLDEYLDAAAASRRRREVARVILLVILFIAAFTVMVNL